MLLELHEAKMGFSEFQLSNVIINKTAGPSNLVKMPFKGRKTFFQKKIHIFSNFSKIKNFLFFAKKITIKVKKTFLRNNII